MKGPSGRLKYHAHRYWLCPRCGHRMRTGGEVVTSNCPACIGTFPVEKCWMTLVENDKKPLTPRNKTLSLLPTPLEQTDGESPQTTPE